MLLLSDVLLHSSVATALKFCYFNKKMQTKYLAHNFFSVKNIVYSYVGIESLPTCSLLQDSVNLLPFWRTTVATV